MIKFDPKTLREATESLFRDLGSLDDLGPELSNSVANAYYKMHLVKNNMDDPLEVLGIHPDNAMSAYRSFMIETNNIIADYKHIKPAVESMREVKNSSQDMFEVLIVCTLDQLKYRIHNSVNKTPIRRAIERKFCKVNEIDGLYKQMNDIITRSRGVDELKQHLLQIVESFVIAFDTSAGGDMEDQIVRRAGLAFSAFYDFLRGNSTPEKIEWLEFEIEWLKTIKVIEDRMLDIFLQLLRSEAPVLSDVDLSNMVIAPEPASPSGPTTLLGGGAPNPEEDETRANADDQAQTRPTPQNSADEMQLSSSMPDITASTPIGAWSAGEFLLLLVPKPRTLAEAMGRRGPSPISYELTLVVVRVASQNPVMFISIERSSGEFLNLMAEELAKETECNTVASELSASGTRCLGVFDQHGHSNLGPVENLGPKEFMIRAIPVFREHFSFTGKIVRIDKKGAPESSNLTGSK